MAQEVKLMGATYSAVPSVLLPDSNDTMHRFTDVTGTTATASDVASGKVFYAADGTETTGTGSGGTGSDYYMWQDANGYLHYSNSALGASGYVITASTEYQAVESWETLYEDTLYANSFYDIQNAMGVTIYQANWSDSAASGSSLVEGDTYRLTVGSDVYRLTAWMDSTYMNSVAIGSDMIGWNGVSSLSCPYEGYMLYMGGTQYVGIYSTTNTATGTFKIEHLL